MRLPRSDDLALQQDGNRISPAFRQLRLDGGGLRRRNELLRLQETEERKIGVVRAEVRGSSAPEAHRDASSVAAKLERPIRGVERRERVEPDGGDDRKVATPR